MEYTLPELEAFGNALNETNKYEDTEESVTGKDAVNALASMGLVTLGDNNGD